MKFSQDSRAKAAAEKVARYLVKYPADIEFRRMLSGILADLTPGECERTNAMFVQVCGRTLFDLIKEQETQPCISNA